MAATSVNHIDISENILPNVQFLLKRSFDRREKKSSFP